MQENSEGRELELYFSEWKEKDKNLEIPEFEWKKKANSGIWKLIPIGIAAAFLLGFWLKTSSETDFTLNKDMVIITLIEDENQQQRFVIETQSSLDVWEAPSSSLLTEF